MNPESKVALKNRTTELDKLIDEEKTRIAPIKQKRDEYNTMIGESDKRIEALKKEHESIKQDIDKSSIADPI
ncbi:MAG: hypothetical protein WC738_04380 [Candidatus Omnitrophota bacterium]|jgi:chromosome segregation ATPase